MNTPQITNEMKAACMGEFTMEVTHSCSSCAYHGAQDDCEVCAGEISYTQMHTVPWDLCKTIYKRMAEAAPKPPALKDIPDDWQLVPKTVTKEMRVGAWSSAAELRPNIKSMLDTMWADLLKHAPKYPMDDTCPKCNGTGEGTMLECSKCDGIGKNPHYTKHPPQMFLSTATAPRPGEVGIDPRVKNTAFDPQWFKDRFGGEI